MCVFKTRKKNKRLRYLTFKIIYWWIFLLYDYDTLRLKFENDNKIFEIYKNFSILLDETLNKNFTDKYKIFIDEYEEEYKKIKNQLRS